jgi:hypothetical protein
MMRQRGLATDVRAAHHAVSDNEWVRFDLLEWRRQSIQAAPQLVEPPGLGPARQLPAHIGGVYLACQEQAGLKDWLIAHDLD